MAVNRCLKCLCVKRKSLYNIVFESNQASLSSYPNNQGSYPPLSNIMLFKKQTNTALGYN